jgi:molybdate transport system permease protein
VEGLSVSGSDRPFLVSLSLLGGLYVVLILAMIGADLAYVTPGGVWATLSTPEIRYSTKLSLFASSASAALSLVLAVPLGYLLSRYRFPGKRLVDAVVDIPIVLPPIVVGMSLLILLGSIRWLPYSVGAVVLAQLAVAAAFAVRTMRVTFDQIGRRSEEVALTLGCTRSQAFRRVVLPEARPGMIAAFTLAWARSLGEFGPVLVFAGTTRLRTEVLSTSVYLEFSIGRLDGAVAISLLMVAVSILVLVVLRRFGSGPIVGGTLQA